MNRKQRRGDGGRHPGARAATSDGSRSRADILLGEALRYQGEGRLAEAERLGLQALRVAPGHGEVLHLLATIAYQRGQLAIAQDRVNQAISQGGSLHIFHNTLGVVLQAQGKPEEAMASYGWALVYQPDYAEAHHNLGGALRALGRLDEAAASYRRALDLTPDSAEGHHNLGLVLRDQGKLEAAAESFRRALDLKPDYAEAHNDLGITLAEQGKLDDARASYRRALTHVPSPKYYYNLSGIKKFSGDDPELAAMAGLARDAGSLSPYNQVALHFALGKAYDDAGDTDRAFQHFSQGNRIKRQQLAYDEAATLGAIDRMPEMLDAARLRDMAGQGHPSSDPIFILGMPRSGSSLVEQILASHPRVAGAGERREFPLLARTHGLLKGAPVSLPNPPLRGLRQFATAYLARLRAVVPDAAHITDKMPTNFIYAGLIHLALPNARIVHTRRDALDTCVSCFFTLFSDGQAHTYDLGELGRYYRAYERLMAHWRSVLPRATFIDVDYEALVADLEGQARRILDHCGLAWDDACLSFHTTDRAVRTASAAQVRQPVYNRSIGRWRAYAPFLGPLRRELDR